MWSGVLEIFEKEEINKVSPLIAYGQENLIYLRYFRYDKMSRTNVSGCLQSCSHLFYLCKGSKVFIIKLQRDSSSSSDPVFVLCSLSNSLETNTRQKCREILLSPPLNNLISLTNLKSVNISTGNQQEVFQLTKSSSVQVQELISYQRPVAGPAATTKLGGGCKKMYAPSFTSFLFQFPTEES